MNNFETNEIERGCWRYIDAVDRINIHYIEDGWNKISERFPKEIEYLEERLEQLWNKKVIKEWESGIKEYLIDCDSWRE